MEHNIEPQGAIDKQFAVMFAQLEETLGKEQVHTILLQCLTFTSLSPLNLVERFGIDNMFKVLFFSLTLSTQIYF